MKLLKTFSKTGKSDGKTIESCRVKKLRIFATKPMKTGYCYKKSRTMTLEKTHFLKQIYK